MGYFARARNDGIRWSLSKPFLIIVPSHLSQTTFLIFFPAPARAGIVAANVAVWIGDRQDTDFLFWG